MPISASQIIRLAGDLAQFRLNPSSRIGDSTAQIFRDRRLFLSLKTNIQTPAADPEYAALVRAVEGAGAFLEAAPDLLQREIDAYHLLASEAPDSPLYLPNSSTNYHVRNISGEKGENIPVNFVSPRLHPYIFTGYPDYNSAYYDALSGHTDLASISFHLGFSSLEITKDPYDGHNVAQTDPLAKDVVQDHCIACLNAFKTEMRQRGYRGALLFETLDYQTDNGRSAYEHVVDADLIAEVQNQTRYGLVLDPAHMLITAMNKGVDPFYYVDSIIGPADPQSLRELHFSIPTFGNNRWSDVHRCLNGNLHTDEALLTLALFAHIFTWKQDSGFISPTTINLETPFEQYPQDIRLVAEFLRSLL